MTCSARSIDLAERVLIERSVFARASLNFVAASLGYSVGLLAIFVSSVYGIKGSALGVVDVVATLLSMGVMCGIIAWALTARELRELVALPRASRRFYATCRCS